MLVDLDFEILKLMMSVTDIEPITPIKCRDSALGIIIVLKVTF